MAKNAKKKRKSRKKVTTPPKPRENLLSDTEVVIVKRDEESGTVAAALADNPEVGHILNVRLLHNTCYGEIVEFNYGCPGPATLNLAHSILNAVEGRDVADVYCERFADAVLSAENKGQWVIAVRGIRSWLKKAYKTRE